MTGFVSRKRILTAPDVAALHTSVAFFCAADFGFQHLAQMLIAIGSKYGNINATDILPS